MKSEESTRPDAAANPPGPDTGPTVESARDESSGADDKVAESAPKVKGRKAKKDAKAAEKAAADRAAAEERLMRLQADFENYRKRTIREKGELSQRANENLIGDLLPVLDHFDLALGALDGSKAEDPFVAGIRLVREQLLSSLGKYGLAPLDAQGGTFDPNQHEAVSHLPSDDVPENGVIAQTRRGYCLGERLLRAAEVVVSSGPAGGGNREAGEG